MPIPSPSQLSGSFFLHKNIIRVIHLSFYAGALAYTEAFIEDTTQVIRGCSKHIHIDGDMMDRFILPDGRFSWKSCREICVVKCSTSHIYFKDWDTDQCAHIVKAKGDPIEIWETPNPETLDLFELDDDNDIKTGD